MIDRLHIQMQAMQMLARSQDVTADNLANINTPGFKSNKVFYQMFTEQINGKEVKSSVPVTQVDLSQGELEPTGNQFDLGINGNGFFKVELDGETRLTRDGRFHLDNEGMLVNNDGAKVMGESGPIQLTEFFQDGSNASVTTQLEITKNGTIRINGVQQDRIQLTNIEDPSALERKGNSYFTVQNEDLLTEEGAGVIQQGYFEKGNVNPLTEMVDMMENMQLFESQQRVLRTTDEMLSQVTTRLSRF